MKTKLFLTSLALFAIIGLSNAQNGQQGHCGQGKGNCKGKSTYVDKNNNGTCDNYENHNCNGKGKCKRFTDTNKNGVCDKFEANTNAKK